MEFYVSQIQENDKAVWMDLSYQADPWALDNNRPDIPESNWRRLMDEYDALQGLALWVDDMLAGYILYSFNPCIKTAGDECQIMDLFVAPEYRRQGGGSLLFEAVRAEAVQKNAGRLRWWFNPNRPDSAGFYETRAVDFSDMQVFAGVWLEGKAKAAT